MIPDYDEKNVEATLDAISGFDATRLQQFLVYEREHKNRKTVIEPIKNRLVEVEVPSEGYYDGFWFDEGGTHVVCDGRRLERALERTAMERVEQPDSNSDSDEADA